jgi:3-methyladenine DNA glycosylase AlkD
MRGRFPFLGVKTQERRAVVRAHINLRGSPSLNEMPQIVRTCWALPEREYQYIGMELLSASAKKLDLQELSLVEELILTKSWWDTVDHLAVHGAGAILFRHQARLEETSDRWIRSGELWLQRTSLIVQLSWKADTQADVLFGNCAALASHQDFFIRKGIGWALRQYARTDPEAVLQFVRAHTLSALSEREAIRGIGRSGSVKGA